jgi:hypothetical protein
MSYRPEIIKYIDILKRQQYFLIIHIKNSDLNKSRDIIRNTAYPGCTVALQRPFIVR